MVDELLSDAVRRLRDAEFGAAERWLIPHATHRVTKVVDALFPDTAQCFACIDCKASIHVMRPTLEGTELIVRAAEVPITDSYAERLRRAMTGVGA